MRRRVCFCTFVTSLANNNVFSLQFLMLKGPDIDGEKVECMEHCEKFWFWLQSKGISSHRSAIVKAVAQKMNGMMGNTIYDPNLYEEDSDEE